MAATMWMITDMQGRVLTNALGAGLRGEQQLHIEVNAWPEGTSLLFLRSTNGAHTKRFMIQR
jgi:uncharacterized protein affecting Mg2+/Co2+ transport